MIGSEGGLGGSLRLGPARRICFVNTTAARTARERETKEESIMVERKERK